MRDRRVYSAALSALLTPTDEPMFAGFTKTGAPSVGRTSSKPGAALPREQGETGQWGCRRPAGAASSRPCPCRPPSRGSPPRRRAGWPAGTGPGSIRPRRRGRAARGRPRRAVAAPVTGQVEEAALLAPGHEGNLPGVIGVSAWEAGGRLRRAAASRSSRRQRPSRSMPMRTGSYFSRSRASSTFFADCRDTSCSADLPPNTTPTRIRFSMSGSMG